jgi:hypothetical protein
MLDSPERVCAGQRRSQSPVTSAPFSNLKVGRECLDRAPGAVGRTRTLACPPGSPAPTRPGDPPPTPDPLG